MTNSELRTRLLSVRTKDKTRHWLLILSLLLAVPLHASTKPSSVYFLGNSFTWDAQPHHISTATTFPDKLEPEIGFGIYSGKSLTFIVENPAEAVTEVGLVASDFYPDPHYTRNFEIDLPGHAWEAVSMQPHTYGGGLFFETEVAAANTVMAKTRQNPANAHTVFFILGPWAFQEGPDKNNGRSYSENWLSGYTQSELQDGVFPNVRQAFRPLFLERLKSDNPDVTIHWIPIGEALFHLDQELRSGAIPGLSGAWELFDEFGVHLHDTDEAGIAGRYLSHVTALSTIWASPPSSFTTKYEGVLDEDFKALVDAVVWDTVQDYLPTYACPDDAANLILHPGLPDNFLKSSMYRVRAHAEGTENFAESAVMEYVKNVGDDPIANDPFNISNPLKQDALNDASHWTSVSYGNNGNPLQFEITLASEEAITSCQVFPGRYQVPATIKEGKAFLALHSPNRYLYLIINDDKKHPLFLFVDPLEEDPPLEGDEGVLYFGPGIHDIGKNYIFPEDKHTVYIALGAYVRGSLFAEDRSNISVRGRGMLSGEGYGLDSEVNAAVHFSGNGTHQVLEGITSIRPVKYHIISRGALHTKNVKCLSYNNTTDGIVSGPNSITEYSFFKVNDDVIKLYYDNQIIRDIVVYHQTNSPVLEFGWSGQSSHNSLVQRVDIIQDETLGLAVDGQAILGWAHNTNPGGEQIGHVLEDIRAENGKKRLVHLNLDAAHGFVDIVCRNWAIAQVEDYGDLFALQPGGIKIAFDNVTVGGNHVSKSDFKNINQSPLQLSFEPLSEGDLPEISLQPQSVLTAPGEDLTLSVEATGPGALDFQWHRDGDPMPGATSSEFKLQNIASGAEARYTVAVTNPFGTTLSKTAVVTFCPLEQTILFPLPDNLPLTQEPISLVASATSGLEVTIEVLGGPATVEGHQLTFTHHGEVALRATQQGNGVWNPASAVEKVFKVYSPADTWRKEHLGTFKNEGTSSDLADPDKDGIPNLLEYFLGTSPLEHNDKAILSSPQNNRQFQYVTTQASSSLNGLQVSFEISNDLVIWNPPPTDNLSIETMESGDLQYRVRTNDLVSPYFLRLKVQPL